MLSLFPNLLDYHFLAITVLRVAAALTFAFIAWRMIEMREDIERVKVVIVGHVREWMVWASATITLAVGMLLFIGLWTQAAAIVGMFIALKHGLGVRRYSAIVPLSGTAYFLLFAICLALLFLGAGAYAFDLPL